MPSSTPIGATTSVADVLSLLDLADRCGVWLCVDGGWGVDALLGRQTRKHGDLDVALEATNLPSLEVELATAGYRRCGEEEATAWNFLMAREDGAVIDLHAIVLDEHGNGVLGPPGLEAVYPAAALSGRGRISGRPVNCISPTWAIAFHDAYTGDEADRADVLALCAHFALPIPTQYQERALTLASSGTHPQVRRPRVPGRGCARGATGTRRGAAGRTSPRIRGVSPAPDAGETPLSMGNPLDATDPVCSAGLVARERFR